MVTFMRMSFVFTLIMFLCSCSIFSGVKTGPTKTYVINTVPSVSKKINTGKTLLVSTMDAEPVYNSSQMAYTEHPYQIAYFSKNGWAVPPAQMLQTLLQQTLQNTHHFHAVISSSGQHYDYVLNTQLIELKQVFFQCTSEIHLKIRAQLVDASDLRVIATKEFFVIESAPQRNPYGGVIAANKATGIILREITQFCLRHI